MSSPSSSRTALRDTDRILTARLRRFLWVILAAAGTIAAIDAALSPDHLALLYAPKVVALVALGLAIRSMRTGHESSRDPAVALLVLSITAVTIAATGALSGHVVPRALVLLMLCVAAAGFLPWGLRRQTALVFVTGASLTVMVWMVRGRLDGALDAPGLVLLAGLSVSLFLSHEGDQLRNERRRAQRALDHRTSDLQSITDAMSRYLADGNLETAASTLLRAAVANTQSSVAYIARTDVSGNLQILTHRDLVEPTAVDIRVGTGGDFLDRILGRGLPTVGNDLGPDSELQTQGLPRTAQPMQNFLGVPISRSSAVVGMIGVANREGGYSPSHTARLELLAQTAGVLFGNDEADRVRREDEAVSTALAGVGRDLMQLLDRPLLLDRMCALTAYALGCDASHTLMLDAGKDRFTVIAGYGDTAEESEALRVLAIPVSMMRDFMSRFDDQETEEVVPSQEDWHRSPARRLAPEFRVTSSLLCPLRRGDDIVGFLVAANRGRPRLFDDRQKRVLEGIGRLASMALHNAGLVEELARANEVRSEFIATMSHELRTPLNVVIGYGNMLEDGTYGDLTSEQIAVLQRIDRSARELHELITTTLDLARLESGRVSIEVSDVDLAHLIRDIVSEVQPLRHDGVGVTWAAEPELPKLETDALKLKVIVKNLVRNAIKFTDAGSVDIRAYRVDDGVEIRVADTGIGIAPEGQEAIFEPFQQLAPGQGGRGGVGLGLNIVRRLVELLKGSVRLESEVGRGSEFFIHLPLPADAEDALSPEQRRAV